MFKPDPKKIVAALLIKHKPEGMDAPSDSEDEDPKALESAAQDVLDAIKADDAKGFAEAFKAMCQLCDEDGEEQGE